MSFSAVILAGGGSRRMGRDKAWLPLGGQPLVKRSLALVAQAGAEEVMISAREGQNFSKLGHPVLVDSAPDLGPLGGIERALSAAQYPLVLVLAVDLPRMTPEFLRGLRLQCLENIGAIPRRDARIEPLVAFYPRQALEIVTEMLSEPIFAAQAFAERCVQHQLASFSPISPEDEYCFENWNTPADVGQI